MTRILGVGCCFHSPLAMALGLPAIVLGWSMSFEGGEMVAEAILGSN